MDTSDHISRIEHLEHTLNQQILDMREDLHEAKKQSTVFAAAEKRSKKQLDHELKKACEWEREAMQAVRDGNDAIAREALMRKAEHERLAVEHQIKWTANKQDADQHRDELRRFQNRVEAVKREKNALISRMRCTQARNTIQNILTEISEPFERIQRKLTEASSTTPTTHQRSTRVNNPQELEKVYIQLLAHAEALLPNIAEPFAVIASHERRARKRLDHELALACEWAAHAEKASEANRDDLVATASSRKSEHDDIASEHQARWEAHREDLDQLSEDLNRFRAMIEVVEHPDFKAAHPNLARVLNTIQDILNDVQDTAP